MRLTIDRILAFILERAAAILEDPVKGGTFNFKMARARKRTPPFPHSS